MAARGTERGDVLLVVCDERGDLLERPRELGGAVVVDELGEEAASSAGVVAELAAAPASSAGVTGAVEGDKIHGKNAKVCLEKKKSKTV